MLEECLDIIWVLFCTILYVNKVKYILMTIKEPHYAALLNLSFLCLNLLNVPLSVIVHADAVSIQAI